MWQILATAPDTTFAPWGVRKARQLMELSLDLRRWLRTNHLHWVASEIGISVEVFLSSSSLGLDASVVLQFRFSVLESGAKLRFGSPDRS